MISQNKTHRRISLFIAILTASIYTNGCTQSNVDDNSTPEMLAKTLLYSIQSNDKELLSKYVVTAEERKTFLGEGYASNSNISEEQLLQNLNSQYNDIVNNTLENIRNTFTQKGLSDWSNVEYYSLEFGEQYSSDKRKNNGSLVFTYEDMAGQIENVEFSLTDDGWKIFSKPEAGDYASKVWLR